MAKQGFSWRENGRVILEFSRICFLKHIVLDVCPKKWMMFFTSCANPIASPAAARIDTIFHRGQLCRRGRKLTSLQGEIDWFISEGSQWKTRDQIIAKVIGY